MSTSGLWLFGMLYSFSLFVSVVLKSCSDHRYMHKDSHDSCGAVFYLSVCTNTVVMLASFSSPLLTSFFYPLFDHMNQQNSPKVPCTTIWSLSCKVTDGLPKTGSWRGVSKVYVCVCVGTQINLWIYILVEYSWAFRSWELWKSWEL